jgi:hypothetical protein
MGALGMPRLAAEGGHLLVRKWAHKWAHQNGCPWNETICSAAARGGQLSVLQWAHEDGCPWNANWKDCRREATCQSGNSSIVVRWLDGHRRDQESADLPERDKDLVQKN